MRKFMMSVSEEMYERLELEQKQRHLENIQATVRTLLSDIFKKNEE